MSRGAHDNASATQSGERTISVRAGILPPEDRCCCSVSVTEKLGAHSELNSSNPTTRADLQRRPGARHFVAEATFKWRIRTRMRLGRRSAHKHTHTIAGTNGNVACVRKRSGTVLYCFTFTWGCARVLKEGSYFLCVLGRIGQRVFYCTHAHTSVYIYVMKRV